MIHSYFRFVLNWSCCRIIMVQFHTKNELKIENLQTVKRKKIERESEFVFLSRQNGFLLNVLRRRDNVGGATESRTIYFGGKVLSFFFSFFLMQLSAFDSTHE